jgi:hypothetical protein
MLHIICTTIYHIMLCLNYTEHMYQSKIATGSKFQHATLITTAADFTLMLQLHN